MTLRNTHTLITAYAALATIAVGMLAYRSPRPVRTEDMFGKLVIESVAKPAGERIAIQSTRKTPREVALK